MARVMRASVGVAGTCGTLRGAFVDAPQAQQIANSKPQTVRKRFMLCLITYFYFEAIDDLEEQTLNRP